MTDPSQDSDRAELAELTAALKVHAEALDESGAVGVPSGELPPWLADADARGRAASVVSERAERQSEPQALQADSLASQRESANEPPHAAEDIPAPAPTAPPTAAPPTTIAAAPPPPAARAEGHVAEGQLRVLKGEVEACTGCELHETRKQTVFSRGSGRSGLCFVGEGPGADEDAQGYPFVGKAGQLLDRLIGTMGLDRDEVYVCNIVKCRPPQNRKPTPDEMSACTPFLARQLDALNPEVIVCLGATAVEGLLGLRGGITRLRGDWRLYRGRIAVMPTFHPAYLLRTPRAKREVWQDMQAVLRHLGRPVPELGKR